MRGSLAAVFFIFHYLLCAQSCPSLFYPTDCSPSGSPVHSVFQGRILEWVTVPSSRVSSRPRDWTCTSCVSYTGRLILYHCATWEALVLFVLIYASYFWYPFKALSFLIEIFLECARCRCEGQLWRGLSTADAERSSGPEGCWPCSFANFEAPLLFQDSVFSGAWEPANGQRWSGWRRQRLCWSL